MSSNTDGKVVAITGASRGRGEATAQPLAWQDARVALGERYTGRSVEIVKR